MAFVQPNTNVWLMKGCLLRPDYQDTYFFSFPDYQFNYLTNGLVAQYTKYSYQRYGKSAIQVQGKIADLFAVNYMAFENSSHENRKFYAFVTDVQYVNENTVRLYYEIDYIQTFLFDFELRDCFVDRMHSRTDEIGENIQPEPVKLEEMFKETIPFDLPDSDPCIVVYATSDSDGNYGIIPIVTGGTYSPVWGKSFDYTFEGAMDLHNELSAYSENGYIDNIVSVELKPKFTKFDDTVRAFSTTLRLSKPTVGDTLSGYRPKNNKLLTYPYNYLVIAGSNNEVSFAYEFFGSNPEFFIYCGATPTDGIHLRASDYMSQTLSEEDVVISYPPIAYNVNTYQAWQARQRATAIPRIIGAGVAVAQTAINIATFGALQTALGASQEMSANINAANASSKADAFGKEVIGGRHAQQLEANANIDSARRAYHNANAVSSTLSGVINDALSIWAQSNVERLNAVSTRGNFADQSEMMAGIYRYRGYRVQLNEKQAKIIDDFFTLYGYSQGRIMTPSLKNRAGWTYIKTVGCELFSDTVHNGILSVIQSIFNGGVRFWVAGSAEIGDYSTPNTPLGG